MKHQLLHATGLFASATLALTLAAAEEEPRERTALESERVNEFFDKCYDEFLARHPVTESQQGIKTHYDQWEDLSDEKAAADLAFVQANLAKLKSDFKLDAVDPQTQLSCKLFERQVEREAEAFRFRFDTYPVNQM